MVAAMHSSGTLMEDINLAVARRVTGDYSLSTLPVAGLIGDMDTQKWCSAVIRRRFDTALCMPNHRPIAALRSRGMIENVVSQERRAREVPDLGFRFNGFRQLLETIGFWEVCGEQLGVDLRGWHALAEDNLFLVGLNVINGNHPDVDYEAIVYTDPRARFFFELLKSDVLGEVTEGPENPSRMSTMHIVGALIFARLTKTRSESEWKHVAQMAFVPLDVKKGNPDRIRAYQELSKLRQGDHLPDFAEMMQELSLPRDHPGRANSISDLSDVDIVIPLFGTGLGREPWYARQLCVKFPDAFFLPCGFHSPDEIKLRGEARASWSEAEEAVACALIDAHPHYFRNIPRMPPLSPAFAPLSASRILMPEMQSIDTAGNAAFANRFVCALSHVLGRPAHVLLVVTSRHSGRAREEFRRALDPSAVASLKAWSVPNPGHEIDIGANVSMNPALNGLADTFKRLFMIGVA